MIILYDVPMRFPQPWAPNIWRIRLILNYKRLPYRTAWVDFPDIEQTLISVGAPPTSFRPDGRPVYTLPAIVDPFGSPTQPIVLSNPAIIAEYLETSYPARQIFPEGSRAVQSLFVHYVQETFVKPLLPIMVPLTHQRLHERSQTHFPLRAATPQPAGPGAWRAVQEQFDFLAAMMDKNGPPDGDGVVAMGQDLTYADFAVCSVLIWIEKVAPHDGWVRVRQWNGGRWGQLWERCRGYMDVF
ncbi:hypothetical protein CONPUDRAFT_112014 [Coniophora puteana RWD-64-598 SS2]|uniref:GST N-terminal domain-containing protein n=1 Tax=Coniophora puteana (strain RWD-64-598) TaxID=741705 RepID=A0A5M3M841_CONPW|nr:uncharacterized protein CONPUDRAFT_112014 [Coniophora puteana RWD-64-598 SS2]EIW75442.1 hypothetical protein CONPUDRAFT_112014 [Coniophora puteana RWD-64-598 SS2]